ncbi:MAG: Crp/Fnr family transcriptional regulator [Firmicutes bacterium]|nr:Crp/Fnr family transcriptional regulator [Bacillota bacterium]
MEQIAQILKQTKLFKDVSQELLQTCIVPRGKTVSYPKGSCLISAGQKCHSFLILLQGTVNIMYYYADGSTSLSSKEAAPRVLALDLVATKSGTSPYFAVAAEPCLVFSFPADLLLKPGSFPEEQRQALLQQFLIMLSHLHMEKEKHLMVLSRNGLRDRIITYLSLQAQWKNSLSFTIPFSREEMAAYLSVNRSNLSHELSRMKQEGIIDFYRNSFTLRKADPFLGSDSQM